MSNKPQLENRIIFPDRAESIKAGKYDSYKVFLDFWNPLSSQMRDYFEEVNSRDESRIIIIRGAQGSGKTMFSKKLSGDYKSTANQIASGKLHKQDKENIWHSISGGTRYGKPEYKITEIQNATNSTTIINVTGDDSIEGVKIKDDKKWIDNLLSRIEGDSSRSWIVFVDNIERGHFIQSLLDVSDSEIQKLKTDPYSVETAAQRFVGLLRTKLKKCLFILMTNNTKIADEIGDAINLQHQDLAVQISLPLPTSEQKEKVVRININRLNKFTYWTCIDRSGPAQKTAIYNALNGAATFPASFKSVNDAIKAETRTGRRASNGLITLFVLTQTLDTTIFPTIGNIWKEEASVNWFYSAYFDFGWTKGILSDSDGAFLESEWNLRIICVGNEFSQNLLSGVKSEFDECKSLLNAISTAVGSGAHNKTRDAKMIEIEKIVKKWSASNFNTDQFWGLNQGRSKTYESVLKLIFPGYDTTKKGSQSARPDVTLTNYVPCSILSAKSSSEDDINIAIKREAHMIEFTALKSLDANGIQKYLAKKLSNYVNMTRNQ